MRKAMIVFGSLLGFVALYSGPAMAELVYGEITSVDTQNKSITLSPKNQGPDIPAQINFTINDDTLRNNLEVQSMDQLAVGDEIVVETDKPMFGSHWEAQSLLTHDQLMNQQAGMARQQTLNSDINTEKPATEGQGAEVSGETNASFASGSEEGTEQARRDAAY